MSTSSLRLRPEQVRHSAARPGVLPQWATTLIDRVREAAESGEEVTVTFRPTSYSPEQLARRLNVSRSTILRRIAADEIQAEKVGSHHRISYAEYERLWDQMMDQMTDLTIADIEADIADE